MQVVGPHAVADQRAEQRRQRVVVVVHPPEQHRLGEQRHPGIGERGDGARRRRVDLACVVAVDRHIDRHVLAERGDQRPVDARRVGDRDAAVDPQHLDARNRGGAPQDPAEAAGRQDHRVAAGQDHLADPGAGGDIGERGVEVFGRHRRGPPPDPFAAEAEPAIDRAGGGRHQQHAVGVAVHKSGERRMGVVADRIVALARAARELARVGQVLARDRVVRRAPLDQPGDVAA